MSSHFTDIAKADALQRFGRNDVYDGKIIAFVNPKSYEFLF